MATVLEGVAKRIVPPRIIAAWYQWKLADRFALFLGVTVAAFLVFMLLAFIVSPQFSLLLLTTFVNAEVTYPLWSSWYGLRPLQGYLFLILITSTTQLTVLWFVLFRGENPLLDALIARGRFVKLDRYPRLERWIAGRKRSGLFVAGLIPNIYPIGLLQQRFAPVKGGLIFLHLGNALKLTLAALAYWTASGWMPFLVVGLVVLVFFLPSRLMERLLPNGR